MGIINPVFWGFGLLAFGFEYLAGWRRCVRINRELGGTFAVPVFMDALHRIYLRALYACALVLLCLRWYLKQKLPLPPPANFETLHTRRDLPLDGRTWTTTRSWPAEKPAVTHGLHDVKSRSTTQSSDMRCRCSGSTVVAVTALGRWEMTRTAIESFLQSTPRVDVRFYNDGSPVDGKRCRAAFPGVGVFAGRKHGLTELWNMAFRHFMNCGCHRFLVISNNDVLVPRRLLHEMASVMDAVPADVLGPLTTRQGLGGRGNYDVKFGHGFYRQQDVGLHSNDLVNVNSNSELLKRTQTGNLEDVHDMLLAHASHTSRRVDISLTEQDAQFLQAGYISRNVTTKAKYSQRAIASPGGILGFFLMFERERARRKQLSNRILFDARNVMTGQEAAIVGPPQFMRCYVCTSCFVLHEKGGTFNYLELQGGSRDNLTAVY